MLRVRFGCGDCATCCDAWGVLPCLRPLTAVFGDGLTSRPGSAIAAARRALLSREATLAPPPPSAAAAAFAQAVRVAAEAAAVVQAGGEGEGEGADAGPSSAAKTAGQKRRRSEAGAAAVGDSQGAGELGRQLREVLGVAVDCEMGPPHVSVASSMGRKVGKGPEAGGKRA